MQICISVSWAAAHRTEDLAGQAGFQRAPRRCGIKAVEAEQRGWGRGKEFAERRSLPTGKLGVGMG